MLELPPFLTRVNIGEVKKGVNWLQPSDFEALTPHVKRTAVKGKVREECRLAVDLERKGRATLPSSDRGDIWA